MNDRGSVTCYICDPDNPNADKEGCLKCEADYVRYIMNLGCPRTVTGCTLGVTGAGAGDADHATPVL